MKRITNELLSFNNKQNVLVYSGSGRFLGIIIKEGIGMYKDDSIGFGIEYVYCVRGVINSYFKKYKFKTKKDLILYLIERKYKLYTED